MKKSSGAIRIFAFTLVLTGSGLLFSFSSAYALPIFAKKYLLPCTACHVAFPKLNDFGIAFRDNGYQLGTDRDAPLENPVVSPFALRTTPIVTVTTATGVLTDQNFSDTVTTGTFDLTGLDLLSAGVLAKNISYSLVIAPFLDNEVDLEAAWIRFSNILDSSWLNIKLGKHELDIPFSEKRGFGLSGLGNAYLVNHYHPGGEVNNNQFEIGSNQYGLEILGHDRASRIRYVVDVNNGSQVAGNQAVSKHPNVYARFSGRMDQKQTSERLGLFGTVGRWPMECKTVGSSSPGVCDNQGTTIPGTGENLKSYSRIGGDFEVSMTPPGSTYLSLAFQYLYGIDEGTLIGPSTIPDTILTCPGLAAAACNTSFNASSGGSQDGTFHGGTVELNWMPTLNSMIFTHYDRILNLQQADTSMPSDYNDQTGLTFGIRYYIHLSASSLVALHGEWSSFTSQKTNLYTGEDQNSQDYLVGVDYAF